jgi:hypothetical protein
MYRMIALLIPFQLGKGRHKLEKDSKNLAETRVMPSAKGVAMYDVAVNIMKR